MHLRSSLIIAVALGAGIAGCSPGGSSTTATATSAATGSLSSTGGTVGNNTNGPSSNGPATNGGSGANTGTSGTSGACASEGGPCATATCCAGLQCTFGYCIPLQAATGAGSVGSTGGSLGGSTAAGSTGTSGIPACTGQSCTSTCCAGATCEFGICIPMNVGSTGGTGATGATGSTGDTAGDDGGAEYDVDVGPMLPLDGGGTVVSGGTTFTVSFDGGTTFITATEANQIQMQLAYPNGDGSQMVGLGYNSAGNVDYQVSSTFDGMSTYTTEEFRDMNEDGTFDRQQETIVDTDGGLPYTRTETVWLYQYPDGGLAAADAGTWQQLWTWSGNNTADELHDPRVGSHHPRDDCTVGFPSSPTDSSQFSLASIAGTNWSVLVSTAGNPGNGGCPASLANTLASQAQQALKLSEQCFDVVNEQLKSNLELAKSRQLYIACGNTCENVDASTDLPDSDFAIANGYQRMNLNLSNSFNKAGTFIGMSSFSAVENEEIFIHELIHFAGQNHAPPPNGDPQGHDVVYGCGRFCTQCQTDGVTYGWPFAGITPQMWSVDAEDCSQDDRKDLVGLLYDIESCDNGNCNNNLCQSSTICCDATTLNCYADGALAMVALGDRDPTYAKDGIGTCVESGGKQGCEDYPLGDGCQVGWGQDLSPGGFDCGSFPITDVCPGTVGGGTSHSAASKAHRQP